MMKKKETGVSFSVKLKSVAAKAEVSSLLKVYADAKGMTQGEALVHVIGTVRSFGELPEITTAGLKEFTSAVEGALQQLNAQTLAMREEIGVISNVLQIASMDVSAEPEFGNDNDDYEEAERQPDMDVRQHARIKGPR